MNSVCQAVDNSKPVTGILPDGRFVLYDPTDLNGQMFWSALTTSCYRVAKTCYIMGDREYGVLIWWRILWCSFKRVEVKKRRHITVGIPS